MSDQNKESFANGFYERLIEYISKNPFFSLWNVAIIIGGIVGYFHYSRIAYIPEIDVKSVATIFIALALTGTFLAILLALIFLMPLFYLRLIIWKNPQQLDTESRIETCNDLAEQALIVKRRVAIALMLRTAILAIGLWSTLIWSLSEKVWRMPEAGFGLVGFILIFTTTIFAKKISRLFELFCERMKKETPDLSQNWLVVHADHIMATGVWIIAFGLIAVMLNSPILNNKNLTDGDKIFWVITFLSVVIFVNTLLAIASFSKGKRYAPLLFLFIAMIPALYFLALPDNTFSVEKVAFSRLGIGSLENSFFLVKSEACDSINVVRASTCIHIDLKNNGNSANVKPEVKSNGCVRPKYLENRLGPEFLLAFEDKISEKSNTKNSKKIEIFIPLKKDDVLLWAFGKTENSGNFQCPNQVG